MSDRKEQAPGLFNDPFYHGPYQYVFGNITRLYIKLPQRKTIELSREVIEEFHEVCRLPKDLLKIIFIYMHDSYCYTDYPKDYHFIVQNFKIGKIISCKIRKYCEIIILGKYHNLSLHWYDDIKPILADRVFTCRCCRHNCFRIEYLICITIPTVNMNDCSQYNKKILLVKLQRIRNLRYEYISYRRKYDRVENEVYFLNDKIIKLEKRSVVAEGIFDYPWSAVEREHFLPKKFRKFVILENDTSCDGEYIDPPNSNLKNKRSYEKWLKLNGSS